MAALDVAGSAPPDCTKSRRIALLLGKSGIAAVSAAATLIACANTGEDASRGSESAQPNASADRIQADVRWLADDSRRGREAGTSEYDAAANYVRDALADAGLAPGNGASFLQDVPLRIGTPTPSEATMSITSQDNRTTALTHLSDFRLFPSVAAAQFDVEAPVIFVGYGVHAPNDGHDDFAGLDLDGKIIAYFGGAPDWFDSERRAHYGSSAQKRKNAAARGAVGAIILRDAASEKRTPWSRVVENPTRTRMTWVAPDGVPDIAGASIKGTATLNADISEALFDGAPRRFAEVRAEADAPDVAPIGFDLATRVKMAGAMSLVEKSSANVIGLIPGADPNLRNEIVIVTAHLDHIGVDAIRMRRGDDGINNGAVDNALGIAILLETARRLSASAPRRTIAFLAVTAEEKGLLGADYFAHFPTTGDAAIVANINIDMPVLFYEFADIVAFGAERSTLGRIAKQAANDAGATLAPDPFPEQGIFTRSDHYRFVEKGVPAIYLIPGPSNGGAAAMNAFLGAHYHRPSDDIDLPIRYDQAARFADINARIVAATANDNVAPRWKKDDFFGDLFASDETARSRY